MAQPDNLLALRDLEARARALASQRYAEGLIDADALERRLERILDATSEAQLAAAVVDLLPPGLPVEDFIAPRTSQALARVAPERQRLLTAFSATRREGRWAPARETTLVSVFGEVELDYGEALLPPGPTRVELQVSASSLRVFVPEDVAVRVDASVILSSLRVDPSIRREPELGGPMLVFGGHIVFSSFTVQKSKHC
ncbi:hypothetical protein G6O69_14835 [Pseudenhygromyxa sp. WMMC2535]|uniref:LiaF domain-containing protein n=1 Tax=Pseudenhygromyxa sp. WMMC2535 TaxID=2712867 RepID=UPI001555D4CA|nr:hypothetical protein [Pseudenhygromyxa sp. WMMC2535]